MKRKREDEPPLPKKKQNREAAAIGDVDAMKCYERSDLYRCTLDTLGQTLELYGVAILPAVLDKKECDQMLHDMWDYLENATKNLEVPIQRENPKTWNQMKHLWPLHGMLLKQFGIGQSSLVWNLRQNPKVCQAFTTLWKTKAENLLTSFDGASFHMPPEETKRGWSNKNYPLWLHTDQSPLRNGKECYQSWVTANEVRAGDATLAVLEKSHALHGACREQFNLQNKSDWFKLETEHVQWYRTEKKCPLVLIRCPAGSHVFWDSRTIHCG